MNHLRLAPQLLDLSITNYYITHTHTLIGTTYESHREETRVIITQV